MNRKHFIIIFVVYLVLMIVVHLLRGGRIPLDNLFGMDKLLHILEYIVFAFLFINTIKNPNFNKILVVIIIGASFGILIEFLQYYVADRYASAYDAIANIIGLCIGSIVTFKYLLISDDKESVH